MYHFIFNMASLTECIWFDSIAVAVLLIVSYFISRSRNRFYWFFVLYLLIYSAICSFIIVFPYLQLHVLLIYHYKHMLTYLSRLSYYQVVICSCVLTISFRSYVRGNILGKVIHLSLHSRYGLNNRNSLRKNLISIKRC